MSTDPLEALIGSENLLILAPAPGDESLACGGLIARCCSQGRPPFVMVLGDGTGFAPHAPPAVQAGIANRHERETRAAVRRLGLPDARLLMAGVYDGAIPTGGPGFDAVVRAVTLVMWGRDCNVICAPSPQHDLATSRIATAVAASSGVGAMTWAADGRRLDIAAHLDAKHAAIAAHRSRPAPAEALLPYESFQC